MGSYAAAEKMGIKLKKQWLATLDNRTRHAHAMLDGQMQDNDKPFQSELGDIMFPGDPAAEPANIYNCRCTLIAAVDGVDMSNAQRRARDPETGESVVIENMTYAEWAGWKEETGQVANPDKSGIMEQRVSKEIPEMTKASKTRGTPTAKDATSEYLKTSTPGHGTITYEDGYKTKSHQTEIAMAEWIHNTFGGDITLLAESSERGVKRPDYLWHKKNWELKTAHSINGADQSMRHAIKQIQDNPGGVILNVLEDMDISKLERQVLGRFLRNDDIKTLDVMILSKGELLKIIRHKK